MVVMLLISIVLAVTIPRFEGGIFQDPEKKMSRWVINTVRSLRSAAIQKQTVQKLVIDLSNHKMWIASDQMDTDQEPEAPLNVYSLPGNINFVDLQYPASDRITSGTADIHFYPAGYSDHVLIHLVNDNAERSTFHIQPLLPKVKIVDEWIDF